MSEHEDQETAPPGAARQFGEFAPGLVHFTDDVLFGQVWTRPELSPRQRINAAMAEVANEASVDLDKSLT